MKTYCVHEVVYPSLNSNLNGISVDIFFVGCKMRCKGCHNTHLQEFIQPNYSLEELACAISASSNANVVTFLGGEPLDQPLDEMIKLGEWILSNTDKKLSLFTGSSFIKVPQWYKDNCTYIKTGRYDEDNLTPENTFLASKNQCMWKKRNGQWEIQRSYEN